MDTSQGQSHDYLVADFSNQAELKQKIEDLVSKKNVNILINNTGGPKGGPIVNAGLEEFLDAYQKHLVCNHILATTVIPGMERSGFW